MSHAFKELNEDQREELQSQYLIDSWSYSKLSEFSRNEKAFEMSYIYGCYGKSSASTIAGQAYHEALENYFKALKDGEILDVVDMEAIAFGHIEKIRPNWWKLQKTTPTVDECKKKAFTLSTQLIRNFMKEIDIYMNDVESILDVEVYCDEYLTVNGVDLPLPCHSKIDLVVRLKNGLNAVIDHKSKAILTNPEDLALTIGRQGITYTKNYEAKTGIPIHEVRFIENKYSQNKDKSPQLSMFILEMDADTRALYEALLYEPLKRMLTAVGDPDYVYLINDADNYIDKAELYAFWAKTQIAEIDEFNVAPGKRDLIAKRLRKIRDSNAANITPKIINKFRENASEFIAYDLSNKNMTQEEKIEHVLRSFGISVEVAHKNDGYSSNTYLLRVSAGVKISSIHNHRLDIANVLDVPNVRISKALVMHEGKSFLAVEFSKQREKDLIFDPSYLDGMKIPVGVDNFGKTIVWDLENHSTPHLLTCGATGSGKSVFIKSTIEYAKLAGVENIVILDPKFEFTSYAKDAGVSVFNDVLEIEEEMKRQVDEMNKLVKSGQKRKTLIVFDEFADAVAQSRSGKQLDNYENQVTGYYKQSAAAQLEGIPPQEKIEKIFLGTDKSLEENLKILLQKGRSSGFRIAAATQRASVKVITGDAKVNFPVQICFRVPKETDSRVVLDEPGAESLAGMGDGLIKSPQYPDIVRFQAFYKPD